MQSKINLKRQIYQQPSQRNTKRGLRSAEAKIIRKWHRNFRKRENRRKRRIEKAIQKGKGDPRELHKRKRKLERATAQEPQPEKLLYGQLFKVATLNIRGAMSPGKREEV